jgi:GAF domain-containing protein
LSVPLEAAGQLVGALTLYRVTPNAFRAEDLHMMMAAGIVFATTLANTAQIKTPAIARTLAQPAFQPQPLLN